MRGDRFLHFDRRNVFATADDDVLLAVHDVDIAFSIPDRHVARVEPVIRHHRAGGFRLPVIAVHHVIAEDHDFSDRIHIARHIAHLRIDDAHFHARNRPSRHRLMSVAVDFVLISDGALLASRSGDGRSLRQAIPGQAFAMECSFDFLEQFGRRRRSPHKNLLHAGEIELADVGRVEQRVGHGRHERHRGRLLLLDQPENGRGLEPPHHYLLEPHHRRSLRATPTVRVEQRDGVQLHPGVVLVEDPGHRQRVQVQGAVGQRHALRCAGAAAGVEKLRDGSFVVRENIRALRMAFREKLLIIVVERNPLLDLGTARRERLYQWRKIVFIHQDPRFGVIEDAGQLRSRQPDVQGHDDGARLNHTVISLQKLMVIETQIRDPLARTHALRKQRAGQPLAPLPEFGVGKPPRATDHTRLLPIQIHRSMHAPNRRQRHNHCRS